MKKTIIIISSIITFCSAKGQTCTCEETLRDAILKVETNYAGFNDKTVGKRSRLYQVQKSKVLRKAKETRTDCLELLYEYIAFFKDAHLVLTENNTTLVIDETSLTYPGGLDIKELAGVWYSELNKSYIRFTKKQNRYLGFVTESEDPDVRKGTLLYEFYYYSNKNFRGVVYNKYRQKIIYSAILTDNLLNITLLEKLTKTKPENSTYKKFLFKAINDSICYIKFPSFSSYYKKDCDTLVDNNRRQIEQSKLMIVDLRDNSGGTIASFANFFDYLYTNPTKYISGYYYASMENVSRAKKRYEARKGSLDSIAKVKNEKFIKNLEESKGFFFLDDPEILVIKTKHVFPQKVVVIVNRNTASAAEMFIMMAKQNTKTIIAGERTNGACDYLEPQFYTLCNPNFFLGVPWIKRTRLEYRKDIDNVGLSPDHLFNGDESLWIGKAIDLYRKLNM